MQLNGAFEQENYNNKINQRVLKKVLILLVGVSLFTLVYFQYNTFNLQTTNTKAIIDSPKINDIYFLDFRLISENLRPGDKYRIAKVIDITGDIVTLVYGNLFYQWQNAAINSIRYGQLSSHDAFKPARYHFSFEEINQMFQQDVIYLAQRPFRNKLYGKPVGPEKTVQRSQLFIKGKKENGIGESFLKEKYSEISLEKAFEFFTQSAQLGYSRGQINLAEMYFSGKHVQKNLKQALYWFKQASLQSDKAAIFKYGIVCKQVVECDVYEFYRSLSQSGVNINIQNMKERNMSVIID